MEGFYEEIKSIFTSHEEGIKYAKFTVFVFICAVAYNLFVIPINLVSGGSGGLGVLLNNIFGVEPALVVFFVSFIMLVLAYLFLDAEQVVSMLFITIAYPLFVHVTTGIDQLVLLDNSHTLVIVIFGGIVMGAAQGAMFKLGLNIGGFSVLAKICYKYTKISVTFVNSFINALLVLLGGYFLGFSMVLYAVLYLIINREVSEKVLLGISTNKTFKIVTNEHEKIEKFIFESLGHDVTIYDTYGGYRGNKKKLIMTVIPTSEFTILKNYVKKIDKKAFIFITDTYEALGQDASLNKSKC